ncbi:hypothetical protein ACOBQX_14270 [Actinokineospora sp. G85]|uniref:hypothetical protein n=1 Tax=Actinokineospora sp. G85 TaxID=3406626 RepID=UPI003C788614
MADNQRPEEPDSQPPARHPGPQVPAPPPVPHQEQPRVVPGQVVPSPALTPEEAERFRQFQEFQRYQEWQRSSQFGSPESDPTEPRPRRTSRPLWRKVLLSKWFRRVIYLLVVVLLLNWAYDKYFGGPDEDLPASQTGGGKTERTVLFATNPKEAVRAFYDNVAQETLPDACTRFATEQVAQSFATHFNAPDCPTAVKRLHTQVTSKNNYAEVFFPTAVSLVPDAGGEVRVSSCDLEVNSGPRLGVFTVKEIDKSRAGQWTIVRHERESC